MEFRALRYFLTVAKHENITKAAEELHLTQPTLSRQLKELEDELGADLFIRGKRRTTLTEEGLFLKTRAEELMALEARTVDELRAREADVRGDVYLGCGETEGMGEVIRALRKLHSMHPHIHVHIRSGNEAFVTDQLEKGLIDFGLLCRQTPPTRYMYRELRHRDRWGLILHRDHPLAKKQTIDREDLYATPLIVSGQIQENEELDHWLGGTLKEQCVVGTYGLLYNALYLAKEQFGAILAFDHILDTTGTLHADLVFRPLVDSFETKNYLIWKKEQAFSRAGALVRDAFLKM